MLQYLDQLKPFTTGHEKEDVDDTGATIKYVVWNNMQAERWLSTARDLADIAA